MHSTVIFIEGFSTSRLEQWFQASQVLSRIICMAKGFCSWHLTNSYDEQLRSYARRERWDFSVQASGNVFQSWTTFFVWNCARKQFQPVKPDRHWHNGGHCVDSSTMQHHSANRKRASIKIKGSSLQCLHAPRHDNTGSRVPGIRLGLRRVRRLTWWICQVRSFCWTALAAIQLPTSNKKHPTHVYLYGRRTSSDSGHEHSLHKSLEPAWFVLVWGNCSPGLEEVWKVLLEFPLEAHFKATFLITSACHI